ncbi:MAG: helicase HerA-like domain-containing protein [Candidatus Pacearchaeota archaeon]
MAYDIVIGRNPEDKERFGDKGLIFLGKGYVKMGQYVSLSNRILMDVARSHVILVAGKRGSGKSYTLGVITEEITNLPKDISQNVSSLIFDTMGIYWTMKYKNEKDSKLLFEWGLEPKNLPVVVFVPYGHYNNYLNKGIPIDESFSLDVSELSADDWIITFGLDMLHPVAVVIQRVLSKLKSKKNFYIDDIISFIENDKRSSLDVKNTAISFFESAKEWGVFSDKKKEATRINDLLKGGRTTILDLSVYNSLGAFNVRALVIGILSRKIFNQRMEARKLEEIGSISKRFSLLSDVEKKENPLVWLFIDEAHEFLKLKEKTPATDSLIQVLREGRQPGISIVLATQQPGQIHRDVMTQSDIVISHRVTSKQDLEALNFIMQSYVSESIKRHMDDLPTLKGSAIILDDNSERIYPIRVRPRFTWHGGEAPSAISYKKEI